MDNFITLTFITIAILSIIYIAYNSIRKNINLNPVYVIGGYLCIFFAGMNIPYNVHPLDVYRGLTELQITYKIINNDTISCDSIVVFKNK